MNAEDRASYDNLKRMIETLEDESDRIVRRGDLRHAAILGSRGEHNWYIFTHLPLNGVEVSLINSYGAKVKSIKHVYLIGLYIISLGPNDEREDESENDRGNEEESDVDELSNPSDASEGEQEERKEESDEVSEVVEHKDSSDPH